MFLIFVFVNGPISRCQDTLDPRHFGTSAKLSRHIGTGAEVSSVLQTLRH